MRRKAAMHGEMADLMTGCAEEEASCGPTRRVAIRHAISCAKRLPALTSPWVLLPLAEARNMGHTAGGACADPGKPRGDSKHAALGMT